MRYDFVDIFRGFSVLSMIFVNTLAFFSLIPFALKHFPDGIGGITFVDLIFPFFLFIVGVSLHFSMQKRKKILKQSNEKITKHVLKRSVLLILIGMLGDNLVRSNSLQLVWGVLEAIGASYFIAFFVSSKNNLFKFVFAFFLILLHFFLLQHPFFHSLAVNFGEGGLPGILTWTFIVVIGLIVGNFFAEKKKFVLKTFSLAFLLTGLGIVLSFFIPLARLTVSESYVVFSAGVSVFLFLLFYYLFEFKKFKAEFLRIFGLNAFFGFFLQFVFIAFVLALNIPEFLTGVSAIIFAAFVTLLNWIVIHNLTLKNMVFKL